MGRLHYETGYTMTLRQQELLQLEERITRDESRMDEITEKLIECDLLEPSRETDGLIQEWHNLNSRIEQNKSKLAQLKAPSQLTEEDQKRRKSETDTKERYNIKY